MTKEEIKKAVENYLSTKDEDIDAEHIAKYLYDNPDYEEEFYNEIHEKMDKFNYGLDKIDMLSQWVYYNKIRKIKQKEYKKYYKEVVRFLRNKGESLVAFPEKYVMLDIETTGLSPEYNEIIEISALRIENNIIVSTFSTLVKPTTKIDDFIIQLTGITNEMLKNAPKIKNALIEFDKFINEDDIIIGYNINFDINFLYDNFKNKLKKEFRNNYVDILRIARMLLKGKTRNCKLKNIAKYFDLDTSKMHRGEKDCELTLEVFNKLKELIIKEYGSLEKYIEIRKRAKYNCIITSEIVSENKEFDISNPCYDRQFVFTGTLEKMTRKEAMQLVVNLGGKINNGVNKETNYLVMGEIDFSKTVNGGKSNKTIKAEKMKLKGEDIEIISENVFYDMIGLD